MVNRPADDNVFDELEGDLEEEEFEDEPSPAVVVSDSRARRKRNRGEAVVTEESGSDKKGRATPSRRRGEIGKANTSTVESLPLVGGIVQYFRGVYAEMQKVSWPTREETTNLTEVVLAVTIAFAIGLGLLDTFYTWWFSKAFEDNTTLFLIVAAGVSVVAGGLVWFLFYRRDETIPY